MMETITIRGARQLGKIWVMMIRMSLMPKVAQAATKSLLLRRSVSARTSRATDGQETIEMAAMIVRTEGLNKATIISAVRKDGTVWKASVTRISTSSTQP